MRVLSVHILTMSVIFAGCLRGPVLEGSADPTDCDASFDDHTHVGEISLGEMRPLAEDPERADFSVRFLITLLMDDTHRAVRFQDASFYGFHDEWYWFRLLNGENACGASTDPWEGESFDDIASIYEWADEVDELPLDLTRVGFDRRLYSQSFYSLVLRTDPRVYATGDLQYRGDDDEFRLALGTWDSPTRREESAIVEALAEVLPRPLR